MNLVDDIPITDDDYAHVNCIIEIPKGTNTKYEYNEMLGFEDDGEIDNKLIAVPHWSPKERYSKLHDIEPEHLKIFRQFFKIYKLDRKSTTKVGDWKSSSVAIKTLKESYDRWKDANKERFHQQWSDKNFWGKIRNGEYIVHPD